MSELSVEATEDPRQALQRSETYLTSRPIEHNLVLSLLAQRSAHPEPGRYWTVHDSTRVVGFALQSPRTFHAALTPMAPEATEALATTIAAEQDTALPGVVAEASTATAFAGAWSELVPARVFPEEAERLYRLDRLRPTPQVSGTLRAATGEDHELLAAWCAAFHDDTGVPGDPATTVKRETRAGRLFVWDDGGPVCMARATTGVAGVSRIGYVYTPPEYRRHGYAAVCVGALCARVRDTEGLTCTLYAQLSNPTSNGVYRNLGFEAVAEVLNYRFSARNS